MINVCKIKKTTEGLPGGPSNSEFTLHAGDIGSTLVWEDAVRQPSPWLRNY